MGYARAMQPMQENKVSVVYLLANSAWARVSNVFGNELVVGAHDLTHAALTRKNNGYLVSVRVTLTLRQGADSLRALFKSRSA